jgi:dipeptidase E
MMNLHLFSSPGDRDIRWVVDAARPYLSKKDEPTIAFLPQAWLNVNQWFEYTVRAFNGLADIALIDTEQMELPQMESIIRRAHVLFISGGNTFLLNHRLHVSGLLPYLRKKVQAGLPLIGFSAGSIICGPTILTAKDLNSVATPHFESLNLVPFNIVTHYDADSYGQSAHDDWLSDYHVFQDNPVIMMNDGAYVKVDGKKTTLVRGDAWILKRNSEKERLVPGDLILP